MKKILLIILLLIVGCGGTDKTPKETKVTSQKRTSSKKKIVKSNQNKIDYDKWLEISKEFPKEFPSREQVFSDQNPLDEKTLIDSEGIMNVPIDKEPFIEPYTGMVSIFDEDYEEVKIGEGNYKNGVKHGKWVRYAPRYYGEDLIIEYYKNGERQGKQLTWKRIKGSGQEPPSETWKKIEVWEDGERVLGFGRFKAITENSSSVGFKKIKKSNISFHNPDYYEFGEWKFWSPNGKDSCKIIYKNSWEDLELHERMLADNWVDINIWSGNKIYWHENSMRRLEVPYKDGGPDGLATFWNENGQKVSERTYEDGKTVLITYYYESGQKEKEGEWKAGGTYETDKEGGKWTYWYENGQKKKEGIHDREWGGQDLYQGEWTYWYENGQKKKFANHVGVSKAVGLYTEWWSNGQKKIEGNWVKVKTETFHDYVKNGLWAEWDESGNVVKETAYKLGDVLWTKP